MQPIKSVDHVASQENAFWHWDMREKEGKERESAKQKQKWKEERELKRIQREKEREKKKKEKEEQIGGGRRQKGKSVGDTAPQVRLPRVHQRLTRRPQVVFVLYTYQVSFRMRKVATAIKVTLYASSVIIESHQSPSQRFSGLTVTPAVNGCIPLCSWEQYCHT